MRDVLGAVKDRVSQTLYLVLHVELGTDAEVRILSLTHTIEQLKISLDSVTSSLTFDTSISLLLHLLGRQVVSVGLTLLNELTHVILDRVEVV